ncbi:MAG: OmpA family protein [Propionibacteriaceae bacterium]|nr:OmpA family protein [Propionibacteriaceae bacterium]
MVASLALVLMAGACSGEALGDDPLFDENGYIGGTNEPSPKGNQEGSTSSDLPVVATIPVAVEDDTLTLTVYPLVRHEDLVIATWDVATPEDLAAEGFEDGFMNAPTYYGHPVGADCGATRLLDLATRTMSFVAVDDQGQAVGPGCYRFGLGWASANERIQRAYAAPPVSQTKIGMIFPGAYIPDVPIVDGPVPAPYPAGASEEVAEETSAVDWSQVVTAATTTVESFSTELDGAVQVVETTEEITITLTSDVLFAYDSASLTETADAIVDAAAMQVEGREGGTIQVIGHTDSDGDEAYNATLSLERADAVAAALSERIGFFTYPIEASGRGESDPIASNDTAEGRAQNRRVEIVLATTENTSEEVRLSDGELPPLSAGLGDEAVTGTGIEGVATRNGEVVISAPRATRVDGHLVVEVTANVVDTGALLGGIADIGEIIEWEPSYYNVVMLGFNPVIVSGTMKHYPLRSLLLRDENNRSVLSGDFWTGAADLLTTRWLAPDNPATYIAIYPDIPGANTVTLQARHANTHFRLTDIPIVNG